MNNNLFIIDSLKESSKPLIVHEQDFRNEVCMIRGFFILRSFYMNELISKSEKMMTTKELAEALNVDVDTVNNAVNQLDFSEVLRKSTGGRPTKVFTEKQATLIKQEIQKHHNLKSRQIDDVTTEVEENETILKAIRILKNRNEELRKRAELAENKNNILMHSEKTYTISEIAKELGYKSAIEFNKVLYNDKIIFKRNGTWIPYSDYSESGYFEIKQSILENELVVYNLRVTQKGREFLLSKYSDKLF